MKKIFFLLIFVLLIPLVYAGAYGAGSFGAGSYGQGQASSSSRPPSSSNIIPPSSGSIRLENSERINQGVALQARSIRRVTIQSKEHFDNPEKAKFPFLLSDNSAHSILVNSINAQKQSALITLSSKPVTVEFDMNSTKKFDLNGNGFYDTEVGLEKIFDTDKAVMVKITALEETESTTPQQNTQINSALTVQNKQDKIILNKSNEKVEDKKENQTVSESADKENPAVIQQQEGFVYKIKYYFSVIINWISNTWSNIFF